MQTTTIPPIHGIIPTSCSISSSNSTTLPCMMSNNNNNDRTIPASSSGYSSTSSASRSSLSASSCNAIITHSDDTTTTTLTNRPVEVASENSKAEKEDCLPFHKPSTTTSFIGGAERARQVARKKMKKQARRIVKPGATETESSQQVSSLLLPRRMNAFERFFAALLRSPITDYLQDKDPSRCAPRLPKNNTVWETACARLGILPPSKPIVSSIPCPSNGHQEDETYLSKVHFESRAALVVEEARYALTQNLQRIQARQQQLQHSKNTNRMTTHHSMGVRMTARILETNSHGHIKCMFQPVVTVGTSKERNPSSSRTLAKEWLYDGRPGCVWKFASCHNHGGDKKEWLGVVVNAPSTFNNYNRRDSTSSSSRASEAATTLSFPCLLFPDGPTMQIDCSDQTSEFWAVPIVPLITEFRCYEAMMIPPRAIAFLHPLLGRKGPIHTRLDHPPSDKDEEVYDSFPKNLINSSDGLSRAFRLPILNDTQETVATTFLQSKPNTITIVQGPPGTGKTTLLVAIICRYLMESQSSNIGEQRRRRRLMVCAPTNKAVSVLALRFLNTLQANQNCPFNAILVGDADKLLAEDSRNNTNKSLTTSSSRQLDSIFLYNWLANIIGGYRRIRAFFAPGYRGHDTVPNLARLAENMQHRITNSLPMLAQDFVNAMDYVTKRLQSLLRTGDGSAARDIVQKTDKLLQMLQEMPPDVVWTQLLLSADVIFTTLASAGGGVFKNTSRIDDLIVDEAAAATEPELYIPFFLRPARLLAVGDPMQLPATVLSQKAIDLGLAKSLHERLMYDCQADHIMLNVQYRMSCQISAFPSEHFYNNKIGNGPNVTSHQYLNGARLLDGLPYMFLQVDGREEQDYSGSLSNRAEATKIVELVLQLRTMANESERFTWNSSDRLRIITFYQAQVSLIKRMLQERGLGNNQIMVATVDSSQGCEADVVLVSFVRSSKPNAKGQSFSAGFLTDDRRMNVALTRARYQLVCVGNVKSFQHMAEAPTLKRLAANAQMRGVVRTPFGNTVDDMNTRLDMFYGETPASPAMKKFRRG